MRAFSPWAGTGRSPAMGIFGCVGHRFATLLLLAYSPRLTGVITFGNCQQTGITVLGPTFLKEVINVPLWLMTVSAEVSF